MTSGKSEISSAACLRMRAASPSPKRTSMRTFFDPTQSLQLLPKRCVADLCFGVVTNTCQRAYDTRAARLLLSESRKRPHCCRAKSASDEISPSHKCPAGRHGIGSGRVLEGANVRLWPMPAKHLILLRLSFAIFQCFTIAFAGRSLVEVGRAFEMRNGGETVR